MVVTIIRIGSDFFHKVYVHTRRCADREYFDTGVFSVFRLWDGQVRVHVMSTVGNQKQNSHRSSSGALCGQEHIVARIFQSAGDVSIATIMNEPINRLDHLCLVVVFIEVEPEIDIGPDAELEHADLRGVRADQQRPDDLDGEIEHATERVDTPRLVQRQDDVALAQRVVTYIPRTQTSHSVANQSITHETIYGQVTSINAYVSNSADLKRWQWHFGIGTANYRELRETLSQKPNSVTNMSVGRGKMFVKSFNSPTPKTPC